MQTHLPFPQSIVSCLHSLVHTTPEQFGALDARTHHFGWQHSEGTQSESETHSTPNKGVCEAVSTASIVGVAEDAGKGIVLLAFGTAVGIGAIFTRWDMQPCNNKKIKTKNTRKAARSGFCLLFTCLFTFARMRLQHMPYSVGIVCPLPQHPAFDPVKGNRTPG